MHDSHDFKKDENSFAITEATGGKNAQKWGCLSYHMSTLSGVLCWPNMSTSPNPLYRTYQRKWPSEETPSAVQHERNIGKCHNITSNS